MLPLLLATALGLSPAGFNEDPPKPEAKPETLKAAGKRSKAPVVPEEEKKDVKDSKEAKEPSEGKSKPVLRRPTAPSKPNVEEGKRLAEAEARASRLASENARLQAELAKGKGPSMADIRTPQEALAELRAGNTRFIEGKRVRTLLSMQDPELRSTLAKGQAPFAVIVTCSDSRLMDNLIFDQEMGRLFTIREAGNCPDIQGIASVEYAVEHLGSKVVVVLGHTSCGAIKAVSSAHGKPLPGNLWILQAAMAGLEEITPHDPNESAEEHFTALAENNAKRQAQVLLDRSEIIRHLAASKKIEILPAIYDLGSGLVKFLSMESRKVEAHH